MSIYSDDKELFKKCREIWNRITKLIGVNNASDFVRTDFYNHEFIMADVHENTSLTEGNYRNEVVIVLDSVLNYYSKALLIHVKKIINAPVNHINKHIKIHNQCMCT